MEPNYPFIVKGISVRKLADFFLPTYCLQQCLNALNILQQMIIYRSLYNFRPNWKFYSGLLSIDRTFCHHETRLLVTERAILTQTLISLLSIPFISFQGWQKKKKISAIHLLLNFLLKGTRYNPSSKSSPVSRRLQGNEF